MNQNLAPATAGHIRPSAAHHLDQNSHIFNALIAAQRCFDWLEAEHFTVLLGTFGGNHSRPILTIETCGKCEWLKEKHGAYAYMYHPVNGVRSTRWRADLLGCRVEWEERGN